MNKKKIVNFIATEKDNVFYEKWLLADKRKPKGSNPYLLYGLVLSALETKQFIYMYRNNLGGLSNRELIYINGVKLQ